MISNCVNKYLLNNNKNTNVKYLNYISTYLLYFYQNLYDRVHEGQILLLIKGERNIYFYLFVGIFFEENYKVFTKVMTNKKLFEGKWKIFTLPLFLETKTNTKIIFFYLIL